MFLLLSLVAVGQPNPVQKGFDDVRGERISLKTNALEWALTVPNIQLEYDLFPGDYNNKTLLAEVKYNWNTWHKLPTFYVFNVFDFRAEFRHHYRCKELKQGEVFNWKSLSSWTATSRPNPRPWLARYVGTYIDFSSFAIKMSTTGKQGWQTGLGVSAGVEFPLYQYKDSAIDMDLGASAGLSLSRNDFFCVNQNATAYAPSGRASRFLFLPVVSEIRATFGWRKVSVRNKYTKTDPEIPMYNLALGDITFAFDNVSREHFDNFQDKAHLEELKNNPDTYRKEYVEWVKETAADLIQNNIETLPVNDKRKAKLRKEVMRLCKKAIASFSPGHEPEIAEEVKQ